jgi:hypothetical protein
MAYASKTRSRRGSNPRAMKVDLAPEEGDWRQSEAEPRDFKKFILMVGLGTLSWVATYIGMLELIQANLGSLPFAHKVVIGFSVAMLMVMIIWLLDQLFKPHGPTVKLAYVGGYLFLTLISVGFGFGFYWKVLESRTEASRSATSATSQVQNSLHAASTRLEQLQATLAQLATVSQEKSELERVKGTSCPNSRPGDGPRRKMRAEDAAKFQFASEFVAGRIGAVKGQMTGLEGDIAKIAKGDPSIIDPKSGTRNQFMRQLSRKLDRTAAGFNAFRSDPQLKQLRTDLAERSNKTVFDAGNGRTFSCPDTQLQQALRGAVRALDELPELKQPKIAVVEGSEATIEAFRRLLATLEGALTFKLPPSADELRDLQKKAVQSALSNEDRKVLATETAGLSSRDYVPLAIAIFVDLCLLLVSMGRYTNRLESLVPKMRAAERGPVIEILSRFKDIHRDPEVRDNFEVFRHVVFDQNGDYYVAVPLDAPFRPNPRHPHQSGYGTEQAQELQHEAHLLANLFTSFEKERIFRRVYNPLLLNTSAIQKRLARQGSKFATCEAFRVYKFRDGAWSEIILGAVMGAARRAENKRRREDIEDQLFGDRSPSMDGGPGAGEAGKIDLEALFAPRSSGHGQDKSILEMPEQDDASVVGASMGPSLHRGGDEGLQQRLQNVERRRQPQGHPQPRPEPEVLAKNAEKFGPYATHVSQPADAIEAGLNDADVTFMAANANTAPSPEPISEPIETETQMPAPPKAAAVTVMTPGQDALVGTVERQTVSATSAVRLAEAQTDASHIDVVLTRDTATVSVPVSEATLPGSISQLLSTALDAAQNADVEDATQAGQGVMIGAGDEKALDHEVLMPVLEAPIEESAEDEVIILEDQTDGPADGEEITTIASRFAARPGE